MSRHTGLFLKYAASLVGLVTLVLLVNGGLDVFISFRDTRQALVRVQEEKAAAAAQRIEQFVTEIEQHIGWTTHAQWAAGSAEQRRFDYIRLTRQAQAITEIVHIDGEGKEQLKVSRLGMDMVGSGEDWSKDPRFIEARARRTEREAAKRVWFSPVYFRKGSEPYLSLAVAGTGRNAGVTVAEINLKLIWDPITAIKVGKQGYAYVVDAEGRLIAHPDISQVLRNTDLSGLPQVQAARAREPASPIARASDGREVLVAYAPIQRLGWFVFVELPLGEALQPLWRTLWQTGGLLLFGLVLALGLGLLLARRMSVPIRAVATGAERLGAGELGHRIDVRTGDEIEGLAQQFNRMAERLEESYAGLERKVEERTHELREALQQQTATTEVLQTINASPGDLRPVFDAMLERAMRLCGAAFGFLTVYDGERFRPAAHRGVPQALIDYFLAGPDTPRLGDAHARILAGEDVVHNPDQMSDEAYRDGNPLRRAVVDLGGARSALVVALRKEREVLGSLTIYRKEVRPFSEKEIELVQNFAAQAVIAMENARLLGELQARQTELARSVEELTATSNVLGLISSSPGELAPVFDAVLKNATRICDTEFGMLWLYKDGVLDLAASHRAPEEFIQVLQGRHVEPGRDTLVGRTLLEGTIVHIRDALEDPEYGWRDAQRSGNLRTILGVPLLREGVPIGVLGLHRTSVRDFTDKQIALVRTFADQAVIAIENARLLGELQDRQAELARSVEELTATSNVLRVISSSPGDLHPVFEALMENATRICEADFGSVWTYDGQFLKTAATSRQAPPEMVRIASRAPIVPQRGTVAGRVLLSRSVVHIEDVLNDKEYTWVEAQRAGGFRSALGVPLMREGEPIGVFSLFRGHVQPFSQKQIGLIATFADQAVIAIENARLLGELQDRQAELARSVEELQATAEVLRIVASSPEDLEPVFSTMLANAVRLCEAQFGTLWTYDDGVFDCVAELGATPAFKQWLAEGPKKAGQTTALGMLERARRVVHIEDIRADASYRAGDPMRRAAADLLGVRSLVAIPMMRETRLVGALMVHRTEVRRFSEKQIELVETFADQAVIAIANVRLVRELRARTGELARSVEELNALREVGQQVSASLDLKIVLKTIVERAVALSGADGGMLWRYDKGGRTFHLRTAHGFGAELVEALSALALPEDQTVMGDATRERRPVELSDIAEIPRMPLRDTMAAAGFRSSLIVPLVGARRIFGALIIQRRSPGAFPPATVSLMQALASQSVLAIQNARLFREIEEKGRQLAVASQHKSQFLANMSHELRTPLNAVLGYAELLVDGLYGELPERARGVLERIQSNGKHLLGLINDVLDLSKIEAGQLVLAHEDYTVMGLVQSVTSATESLARAKGLALETDVPAGLPIGHGDERRLTQVLLNLVGNAIKFTETGQVAILARAAGGFFEIAVSDTGPGIAEADQARIFEEFQQVDNSSTRKKGGTGLGLAISRRIVAMHGGTLTVESRAGEGATFRIRVPVRSEEKKEAAE